MLSHPDTGRLDHAMQLAEQAMQIELASLTGLLERNRHPLREAIATIANSSGRLVVCGLGKSGHIGTKIAASMASMGVPSLFLHASEALHGDFGMCTPADVGLLISYSGATSEVVQVATMMRHIGMELVAMTGVADSELGRLAAVRLDIAVPSEADPLDLAPTASTMTTLALGDALAVGLQGLLDFTEDDFALRHPGGSLGRKLLADQGIDHD